jgi:hypothetical protein
MRSDEKPFRVGSSSFGRFRAGANRSYQRVFGCYCASARVRDSGGFPREASRTKDAERRNKTSTRAGKDTRSGQDP